MDDNINKPNLQDNPSTEGINKRPRLITEIVDLPQGVLIVGEKSSLARFFRETMAKEGIQINNENNFKYIFQFEDFDKTNIYLEKAQDKNAKFFLILDERKPDKFSKEAEKITQNFLQSHHNDGEIIKLKNLFGKEEEFVKQIWALTLRTNLNETVILENKVVKNDQEEILSFFPQKEKIKKEKKVHPPKRFPKVTTFFFFLLIVISPLIFVLSNIFLGLINLKSSRDAIINSQFEKAEKRAWLATEHFSVARRGIDKIEPLFYVLGKEDLEKEIEDWFTIGEETG